MRKIVVALFCGLAALTTVVPASAAKPVPKGSTQSRPMTEADWNLHDRAVYVVSTINLLHTKGGQPVSSVMQRRFGVRRYQVYADNTVPDLYFIDLTRADGTLVGTLAYRMGWQKPMSVTLSMDRFRVARAGELIASWYRTDRKTLIGTFTSTLPS